MSDRKTRRLRRQKRRKIISLILLVLIICIVALLLTTRYAYKIRPVDDSRKNVVGLYAEQNNTLDMVYIGNDSVSSNWSPLQAYNDHGIASYSLSVKDMPGAAVKNMIEETRKSQNPQLYVLDIYPFAQINNENYYTKETIRNISNALKYSHNRYNMISSLIEYSTDNISKTDILKIHADVIPNFLNRNALTSESEKYRFNNVESKYKGFSQSNHLNTSQVSPYNVSDEKVTDLNEKTVIVLEDLFDYIDKKNLDVLFTNSPRIVNDRSKQLYESLEKHISDEGYDFYDSTDDYEKMNIDQTKDFDDKNHLNYLGASKYTDSFGDYLTDEYKFPDRRDYDDYKEWGEIYEKYVYDIKEEYYSQGLISGNLLYTLRPVDNNRRGMVGIYGEPRDSLDVVYIGASSVYRAWSPLQAWREYGFTSYSYGVQGLPASTIKNLIIESEKTQRPKLYVLDISPLMQISTDKKYTRDHLFRVTNGLNYSANRTNAINETKKYILEDLTDEEIKNYELDVYTNIENKENLDQTAYLYENNDVKSAYKGYRLEVKPSVDNTLPSGITSNHELTTIDERTYQIMDRLFEYIKKEKLNVLFTYPPRYVDSKTKPIYNTIRKYIEEKGYEFYDGTDNIKELGIDFRTDLYNGNHLNYLGTKKYTKNFGQYLSKTYNLRDKRKDKDFESWNKSFEKYREKAKEVESLL